MSRERRLVSLVVPDTSELFTHAPTGEIDGLNLQGTPIECRSAAFLIRQNHVYPAYVRVSIFSLQKANLGGYGGFGSTQDDLTHPLKDGHVLFKSPGAEDPQSGLRARYRSSYTIVIFV